MSDPNASPGTAGAAQAQGIGGATPSPEAGTEQRSGGPIQAPGGGGQEGITDQQQKGTPNWEKMAKDFQSKAGKLEQWLGPLAQVNPQTGRTYMEDLGSGQNALALVQVGSQVLNDPKLREAIQGYLTTGKLSASSGSGGGGDASMDDDDLFLDDGQKMLLERLEKLEGGVNALASRQTQTMQAQGWDNLQKQTSSFYQRYPTMTTEERDAFEQKLNAQVQQLIAVNPQAVLGMTEQQFRMIATPLLEDTVPLLTLAQRSIQQKGQQLGALATDAPLGLSTTGQEPASADELDKLPLKQRARAIMRMARQQAEQSMG